MGLQDMLKRFTRGRKEQVDQAFDKAEQVARERTGGESGEKIANVRDKAQEAVTGERPERTDEGGAEQAGGESSSENESGQKQADDQQKGKHEAG